MMYTLKMISTSYGKTYVCIFVSDYFDGCRCLLSSSKKYIKTGKKKITHHLEHTPHIHPGCIIQCVYGNPLVTLYTLCPAAQITSKRDTYTQRWINVGPASVTLDPALDQRVLLAVMTSGHRRVHSSCVWPRSQQSCVNDGVLHVRKRNPTLGRRWLNAGPTFDTLDQNQSSAGPSPPGSGVQQPGSEAHPYITYTDVKT